MMQVFLNNFLFIIGIGGVIVVILIMFKVQGFVSLFEKAIGIVIQQLCSLIFETVFLFFKIFNSLEIYVVLLIDALTGKSSSSGKMASMAIGALSLASFYTTYTGMKYFIEADSYWIAFLVTLGIQAILFSTSMRLSETLDLTKGNNEGFQYGKLIVGAGISVIVGCIVSYMTPLLSLPYSIEYRIYHIMYMIVICSILVCFYFLIKELIQKSSTNRNAGIFLIIIYFVVLSVSSFFSYQSFVSVMYPDSISDEDAYRRYKIEVVSLLEYVEKKLDVDYYEAILQELEVELKTVDTTGVNEDILLSAGEKELYNRRDEVYEYLELQEELNELNEKLDNDRRNYIKEQEIWSKTNDGIGPSTIEFRNKMEEKYQESKKKTENEIKEIKKKLEETDVYIKDNIDQLEKVMDKVKIDYSEDLNTIHRLLIKEHLEKEEERELQESFDNIEQIIVKLKKDYLNDNNNLWNMASVYRDYKEFNYMYFDTLDAIMNISVMGEGYEDAEDKIYSNAQTLIEQLPDTSYIFLLDNGTKLKTNRIYVSNYYESLSVIKHKASPNLSVTEKNLRTFLNNKVVGILCALMALIIDMMILFVGIILPPDIDFWKKDKSYSEQEKKRILDNLFNKPMRR